MNALRSQAIDIIVELPESYIAYTLDILKNVKQMSVLNASNEKTGIIPFSLHKRKNSSKIQATIDALAGALPDTNMKLADFREERLKKYANLG